MLYVFAVLNCEPREAPGPGILGEPLRVVSCGSLFAAVSDMAGTPPLEERSLRVHERVVRQLAGSVDAILPARFGSMVPDEKMLASSLAHQEPQLRQALALVEGREQMTLRVSGEKTSAPEMPGEDAALGPGARYLAGKRRAREREFWIPELDALRQKLLPMVTAERIQPHRTPPLLASVYHLIERGQSARYIAALEAAAAGTGSVRFAVSGPWPPYAFARWEGL